MRSGVELGKKESPKRRVSAIVLTLMRKFIVLGNHTPHQLFNLKRLIGGEEADLKYRRMRIVFLKRGGLRGYVYNSCEQ